MVVNIAELDLADIGASGIRVGKITGSLIGLKNLVAGSNITLTDDTANDTIIIESTGGGGGGDVFLDIANIFTKEQHIEADDPDIYTPLDVYIPTNDLYNGPAFDFYLNNSADAKYLAGEIVIEAEAATAGAESTYFGVGLKSLGADVQSFAVTPDRIQFGSNQRARMSDSGLSANRNFTFPDADSLLFGNGVDNSLGDHFLDIGDIAAPSNPSAGTRRLFFNTATGKLSVRTSAGTTVSLEEQDTGEVNTASNLGSGEGVYKTKVGVDLQFRSITATSSKIALANNTNDIGINVVEANLTLDNIGGTLGIAKGGTGQATALEAFNGLSPLTTLGDVLYNDGTDDVRLAGNTTTTKKFLRQTGNGSVSAAPAWDTIVAGDIPNDAITFARMQNITSDTLLGRDTASSGDPEEISVSGGLEFTGSAGIQRSALSGDITASAGSNSTTIANDAVTFAKFQNITDARLLGRSAGSDGDMQHITVGTGLSLSAGNLAVASSVILDTETNQITDALMAAHTTTKITTTSKSLLNSAIVFNDQTNAFGDFNQDFKDNKLRVQNPAETFYYTIVAAAIAADRTLNLPLITGTDTLAVLSLAQTFANKTLDSSCSVNVSALPASVILDTESNQITDALVSAHTTTKITTTSKSLLNSSLVYIDQTNVYGDFAQEFKDNQVKLWNPADTFKMTLVCPAIVADRSLNLPLITATDTLASLGLAQTFSLAQTYTKSIIANGGFNEQQVTKVNTDSPYTASVDDSTIIIDATSGAFTLNLPAAASNTGKKYKIVRKDIASSTNLVTIDANASETIDGILTWRLAPGEKLEIISDGTNWIITWHNNPSTQGYFFQKNSTNDRRYVAGVNTSINGLITSTTSPAANTLWALPFVVDKVTKFDTISFAVTTVAAGKSARAGIYYDSGNMYPGALMFDTGTISVASGTIKDTTITSSLQVFQPGLYWLAWETDAGATLQIRVIPATANSAMPIFQADSILSTGNFAYGYSVAHTYGSLPDPYTAGATLLTTTPAAGVPIPAIGLRAV